MSSLRMFFSVRSRKFLFFVIVALAILGFLNMKSLFMSNNTFVTNDVFPSTLAYSSRNWYFMSAYLDHREYPNAVITIHGVKRSDANDIFFKCMKLFASDKSWEREINLPAEELKHHDQHVGKGDMRTLRFGAFPLKMTLFSPFVLATLKISHSRTVNSLSSDKEIELNLTYIPPLGSIKPKYRFAICIAPTLDFISTERVIEFIEMNRILGAEHFYFYDHTTGDTNPSLKSVWKFYKQQDKDNRSIVSLSKWNIPWSYDDKDVQYHLQLLQIQHCLYRSIMESRYTMFYDLNEVLIPTNRLTWHELVKQMNFYGNDKRCSICFPMAYFKYNSTYNNKYGALNKAAYFTDTVATNSHAGMGKCMTRTAYVYEMDVHSTRQCIEGYSHNSGNEYGLIHHYYSHYCSFQESLNVQLCKMNQQPNTNILKYEQTFIKRVANVQQLI